MPWHEAGREAGARDAAAHAPPFALVESGLHGLTLTAVNAGAWREGLRPGLALADARAALPELLTAPAEPEHDRTALAALAAWAGRYGPTRNVEGRDGVWIDSSGVAHLFGGEAAMLGDLLARLTRAGLSAHAGLADTPGAAFALARFATTSTAPVRIAAPGTAREALAPLPVAALRLPAPGVVLLHRLGLRRIGQLYALPRDALAQRFRSAPGGRGNAHRKRAALMAGSVLARLDQALGTSAEPREPLAEPPPHLARRLLAEPLISTAGVTTTLEVLAHDLARQLDARGQGGTRFVLALYRVDGSASEIRIGASSPCRDPRHLLALFADRLDALDAGFGIDAMTLACTHAEALADRQIELARGGYETGAATTAALLDRLSNRLGAGRVLRLAPFDSHIPERAQRRVPVLAGSEPAAAAPGAAAGPGARAQRPAFLLAEPEPIAVLAEVPEGAPLRFSWRRLVHRIVRAEGPERIEPEWWRSIGRPPARAGLAQEILLARPRDYYRIEDEHGGRYWVFRAGLYGRDEGKGEEAEATARDEACRPTGPGWFMHAVLG